MAIPHILYISPGLLKRSRGKYLSRSDLQQLALNRTCFIGAHGLTHRNLRDCNSVEMRHEILTSKLMLEDLISREIKSFSFPYGAATYAAIQVLQESGFTSAVTSRTGVIHSESNPFLLNRTEIAPGEEDCLFNLKIKGAFDWHHLRQYDLNEIQRQLMSDSTETAYLQQWL
ncbi:MAG: polysaccharide deacetylase family protein [Candidatus Marinimicrobia bacterium]|nr:polysaccharide deacetylase family protein [Candidatus Neomarinimicrobiota bacterium]